MGSSGLKSDALASPTPDSAKSSKEFDLEQAEFECPHHLEVSHHSICILRMTKKVPFVGPQHLPKFWGKQPKATTKVTTKATKYGVIRPAPSAMRFKLCCL